MPKDSWETCGLKTIAEVVEDIGSVFHAPGGMGEGGASDCTAGILSERRAIGLAEQSLVM